MKKNLHNHIFLAIFLGIALGLSLWSIDCESTWCEQLIWLLDLGGKTIFIGALKMLIAPLIFSSIVAGITSLSSGEKLERISKRVALYYLTTSTVAVLIGIVEPGRWDSAKLITESRRAQLSVIEENLRMEDISEESFHERFLFEIRKAEDTQRLSQEEVSELYRKVQESQSTPLAYIKQIIQEILQNPFYALTHSSSLGIIFFAILLGLACAVLGEEAKSLTNFFRSLNAAIMKLTHWIMAFSPIGIFCLMAGIVSTHGPTVFATLSGYVATVLIGIALHICFLLFICKYFGKMPISKLLSGMKKALLVAFSTRSSAATLPITMECVETNLGVKKEVSEFALPLGATMNMDGTALYEGVAVIFLIQLFGSMPDVGINLTFLPLILIFITAVLASIGAAAVPDAGLITMVLVASAVGLPEYYLIYIFSVDAFLDMFRTTTNVLGDAIGTIIVDKNILH